MQAQPPSEHELTELQTELLQRGGGLGKYLSLHDISDAVQEANVDLIETIRNNKVRTSLKGLSHRIVRCKGARIIGGQNRDRKWIENDKGLLVPKRLEVIDPYQAAEQSELAAALREALMQLHGADRYAVILRYFHHMPYRHIAEVLGLPDENAVTTCLRRAYKAMREPMEGWAD